LTSDNVHVPNYIYAVTFVFTRSRKGISFLGVWQVSYW